MHDEQLKYKIGITLIKGIGNNLAKNLIAYLGSAEAVFKERQSTLAKIPGIGDVLSREIAAQGVLTRAEAEIEFISKNDIQSFYYADREYPFRLKECHDAPIMLYRKGECSLNNGKFVAIVGTRNATENGRENCQKLVAGLSAHQIDFVVVSGLAYGVDICAHKSAVEVGIPTIGVVGHGLDRLYPSSHYATSQKMIATGGALLTEYLSGTNPEAPNFVQRNRIIAGLCDAVVVVESGVKGGSLITVEMANEYNRDVFAYPGRVTDEWSAGCNALIRSNKASLVESADDLCRFMNWENRGIKGETAVQTSLFLELTDEEQQLISFLRQHTEGVQVNSLAVSMKMPFSKITALLLEMEFKGLVKCLPGNVYKVVK
jgi:DNA processing protein